MDESAVSSQRPQVVLYGSEGVDELLSESARAVGFSTHVCTSTSAACQVLTATSAPALVLYIRDPGHAGLEFLKEIKLAWPQVVVLVLAGSPTVATAVEAMRQGAWDYREKPLARPQGRALFFELYEYLSGGAHARKASAEAPSVGTLAEVEKRALLAAIACSGGRKAEAAKLLGMGKTTLYRKLREYGLD